MKHFISICVLFLRHKNSQKLYESEHFNILLQRITVKILESLCLEKRRILNIISLLNVEKALFVLA